jgi:hypothetical protein
MPKFNITPYSDIFRDESIHLNGMKVAEEIDSLQKWVIGVAGLASLYRLLPKSKVSTVLYPGLIPEHPLPEAISIAKELDSPWFLCAGHHLGYPQGFKDSPVEGRSRKYLSEESVRDNFTEIHYSGRDRFVTQIHAQHTGQQAEWVVDQVIEKDIQAIVIMAAIGHLFPRAYCTQLMALEKRGLRIPVIPVPHAINPFVQMIPDMSQDPAEDTDNHFSQIEFHLGEHKRMLDYSQKTPADVTPIELLQDYGEWLSKHEIFE